LLKLKLAIGGAVSARTSDVSIGGGRCAAVGLAHAVNQL
jgi:hypothetical protein